MKKKKMKPEIKQIWLDALRSDEYQQGTEVLCSSDHKFCCLGVLTDLAAKAGVLPQGKLKEAGNMLLYSDGSGDINDNQGSLLPTVVTAWAGLESNSPRVTHGDLSGLNDTGRSFAEIANMIEQDL